MSSEAFTPGLRIKERDLVIKTRRLPIFGEVLVKEGDTVSPETVVARTSVPGNSTVVNANNVLGVDSEDIKDFMVKKVGETVKKNEPLAVCRAAFGLINRKCLSPIDGTVEYVSDVTGEVTIREKPVPVEVKAYIPGTVVKVLPKEGIVVQSSAVFIQGIFGIGGETWGELVVVSEKNEDELKAEQITSEFKGKVLVGGSLVTRNALSKAVEVGAKGIIVGGIVDKDLIDFLGYEIGVAITGQEELGLTLIITEGFGKMKMSNRTFVLLKKFEGKLTCINGATQIRAGVLRPEVIIAHGTLADSASAKEEEASEVGLNPGTHIRIIREPYFGAIGKVLSLPIELQQLEQESSVRVLVAELEDGREVTVPRANVEIIEE